MRDRRGTESGIGVIGEERMGEMGSVPVVGSGVLESVRDIRELLDGLYLQEALTQLLILKVSVFRANTQVWLRRTEAQVDCSLHWWRENWLFCP